MFAILSGLLGPSGSMILALLPELCVSRDAVPAALIKRLRLSSLVSEEDVQAIYTLPIAFRDAPANQIIVRDGEKPAECCLIVNGFCVRSKTTLEGRTQILSIHIPGEIPDLQGLLLKVMDHDLITLTACTLGFISHEAMRHLYRGRPHIAEIFWRDTLIDAAMFREWLVNVGQRPAPARLAHVIVELQQRLKAIDGLNGQSLEMPLTQEQIGDALGITPVHANRVIRQLRQEGIVRFHRGYVTILDEPALRELAGFDGRYLHRLPIR